MVIQVPPRVSDTQDWRDMSDEEFRNYLRNTEADRAVGVIDAAKSQGYTPSLAAQVADNAAAAAFSPLGVMRSAQAIAREVESSTLRQRLQGAPVLSSFIHRDPVQGARLADSTEALADLERLIGRPRDLPSSRGGNVVWEVGGEVIDMPRSLGAGLTSLAGYTIGGTGQLLRSGDQVDEFIGEYIADPIINTLSSTVRLISEGLIGEEATESAGRAIFDSDIIQTLSRGTNSIREAFSPAADALDAFGNVAGEFLIDVSEPIKEFSDLLRPDEGGIEDIIFEGIGMIAGAIGLSYVGGSALTTTSFAAMGADMQAERLEAAGINPDSFEGFTAMVLGAGVTALSEQIRLGRIFSHGISKNNSALARFFNRIGVLQPVSRGVGEAIEEWGQEGVEGFLHNIVQLTYDEDTEIFSGLLEEMTAASASAFLFQMIMEGMVPGRARATRSAATQENMQAIREALENVPAMQHSRGLLAEYINEASPDANINISASGVELILGQENGREMLQSVGIDDDAIAAALLGSDARITVGSLTTSDFFDQLSPHARRSAEDMTVYETEQGILRDVVNVDLAEIARQIAQDERQRQDVSVVVENIERQLTAAGRPAEEAQAASAVWAAAMDGLSNLTGRSAAEVFEAFNVSIQSGFKTASERRQQEALRQEASNPRYATSFGSANEGSQGMLNVGLNVGEEVGALQIEEIESNLPEGVEIVAQTRVDPKDNSRVQEPTVIMELSRPLTPPELFKLSKALNQEAIAQLGRDGQGELQGPNAKDWGGKFNPRFFVTPDGRSTAEVYMEGLVREQLAEFLNEDGNLPVIHFANEAYGEIDVDKSGSGLDLTTKPIRERRRLPGWVNRAYFGIGTGRPNGYRKEFNLGNVALQAEVDPDRIYPLDEDPLGLVEDAYAEHGETPRARNEAEAKIKEEGFLGYHGRGAFGPVLVSFESLQVTPVTNTTFNQEGVQLLSNVLVPRGTGSGKGGKVKISDIGQAMTDEHLRMFGKKFFPEANEEDFNAVLEYGEAEIADQMAQDNSGIGWYDENTAEAIRATALMFPTLLENKDHRDLYLTLAGIFSNGKDPDQAWVIAGEAFSYFIATGNVPIERLTAEGKPVGVNKETGQPTGWSQRNAQNVQHLRFINFLIDREGGLRGALDWMTSRHSREDINEAMVSAGIHQKGRYVTQAAKDGPPAWGFFAFGPKLGPYAMSLYGVDVTADETVIDLWYTRTYRRWTGRLMDAPIGKEGVAAQPANDAEREAIFRLTEGLAEKFDMEPRDIQAVLWFFEKRIWRNQGVTVSDGTNLNGAITLLKKNGITYDAGRGDGQDSSVTYAQETREPVSFGNGRGEPYRAAPDEVDAISAQFQSTQVQYSLDEIMDAAPSLQEELAQATREIAKQIGAEAAIPKHKARVDVESKIERKGYTDTGQLADIMRTSILINSIDQYQSAIEALAERYEVMDEGWATTTRNGENGYFDAKVAVRFSNGMLGEVQLLPPALFKEKHFGQGHALYKEMRELMRKGDSDGLSELEARSFEIYTKALKDEPYWLGIRSILAAAKGKVSSQTLLSSVIPSMTNDAGSDASTQRNGRVGTKTNATYSVFDGTVPTTAALPSSLMKYSISMGDGSSVQLDSLSEGQTVYNLPRTYNQEGSVRRRLIGYTGAPVRFTRFSRDFIGSGEGIHVYGWGFYTAENIAVAREYYNRYVKNPSVEIRKTLPMPREGDVGYDLVQDAVLSLTLPGGFFDGAWSHRNTVRGQGDNYAGTLFTYPDTPGKLYQDGVVEAYKAVESFIEERGLNVISKELPENSALLANRTRASFTILDENDEVFEIRLSGAFINDGRDKTVVEIIVLPAIPQPQAGLHQTEFEDGPWLDWDKLFSTENYDADALQRVRDGIEGGWDAAIASGRGGPELMFWGQLHKSARSGMTTGSQIYSMLTGVLGSQQAASEWLYERGIVGTKYLDGFSRDKGEGTYNYVLYNEADIDVVDNTLRQEAVPFAQPAPDADGVIRVNGREYRPRREGEDLKPYMKAEIDTRPAPEALPFEPARFFDLSGPHQMVPIDQIVSTKSEEENQQGGSNAPKRFLAAYDGILEPRGPITVRENADGTYEIVDGNGTYTAFKNYGWKEIPVEIEGQDADVLRSEGDGAQVNADVTFSMDGATVRLYESADASSFLHESAHIFLEMYAKLEGEYAEVAEVMNDVRQWLGAGPDQRLTRDQHEKFARQFEAYLMEGKAPTPELRTAFRNFAEWFRKVYARLKNNLPNLDPEAKKIFDRMLAGGVAVEQQQRQSMLHLAEAMQGIMTEEEIAKHQRLVDRAGNEAEEEMLRRIAEKIERANRREVAAQRKEIRDNVAAEVDADPLFALIERLTNGGGEQLNRQAVLRYLTEDQIKRLPRGRRGVIAQEGGVTDLDEFAIENNFAGADGMLKRMVGANNRNTEISDRVERVAEKRGVGIMNEFQIEAAAIASVFTSGASERLAVELNALSRKAAIKGVPLAAIRAEATRIIDETPISEAIKPGRYAASSRALYRKALRFAAQENYTDAVKSMQQALMQHELARLAYKARTEIEKGNRRVARFRPSKKLDAARYASEYIQPIHDLYALAGAENSSELALKVSSFADKEEAGVSLPVGVLDGTGLPEQRSMTMQQFREWRDALLSLGKVARDVQSYRKGERLREIVADAQGVEDNAGNKHARSELNDRGEKKNAFIRHGSNFFASLRRLPYLARVLDGGPDAIGRTYQWLIEPLRAASNDATQMKNANQDWFQSFFQQYSDVLSFNQSFYSQALGKDISGEEIFAILSNTGNADNVARLLSMPARASTVEEQQNPKLFFPRGQLQLQEFLDEFGTPERMQAVQELLDYINSYWGRIAEVHRRVTGVTPQKVEATPITAQGNTYRGGYYPLAYDPLTPGQDPKKKGTADTESNVRAYDDAQIKSGVLTMASTRQGHTMSRANGVKRRLDLRLDVATRHLDNVAHDIAFRETFTDVWQRLNNDAMETAITNAIGEENYTAMRTMVQRIVAGQNVPQGFYGKLLRGLRTRAVTALLGVNMRVVLTQPLALTQSYSKLGTKQMTAAIAQYISDPVGVVKIIKEKSTFMRNRDRTMARDVKEALRENRQNTAVDKLRAMSLWMMQKTDMYGAAAPTWLAAYNSKIDEGWTDSKASLFADTMVADTQGSGEEMDLSVMQSGEETEKMFSFMYGYFSGTFNLSVEALQNVQQGKVAKGLSQLFLMHVVQGALASLLMRGLPGDDDDDGDWIDDYASAMAMGTIENMVGSVPLAREAMTAMTFGSGQETSYGRALGTGARFINRAGRTIEDFYEDGTIEADNLSRLTIDGLRLTGLATGLPTYQAARIADAALLDETPSAYEILVSGRDRRDD